MWCCHLPYKCELIFFDHGPNNGMYNEKCPFARSFPCTGVLLLGGWNISCVVYFSTTGCFNGKPTILVLKWSYSRSSPLSAHPDLIFVTKRGTILTMDDSNPTVEAQHGEKITAVGLTGDILKLKGPSTKVVELQGSQTLMPGLIEPHAHTPRYMCFRVSRLTCINGFK